MPAKPSDLWQRIERELPTTAEPVTLSKRFGVWVRESPYGAGLVSMAASVLLGGASSVRREQWRGGAMAMHGSDGHSHDGDVGRTYGRVCRGDGQVFGELVRDPDAAERMLLAKYDGEKVDAEGAVKLVGYRLIVSGGSPRVILGVD